MVCVLPHFRTLLTFVFITDQNNLYRGRVFGELDSHVNAHVENGVLTAVTHVIQTKCPFNLKLYHFTVHHTAT